MGEWANSKLGKSVFGAVFGPHRAKIRLGEFKAVYSIYDRYGPSSLFCDRHVKVHSDKRTKVITVKHLLFA